MSLNTEKYRPEITPYLKNFHAVTYFQDWLNSVEQNQENFTKDNHLKIFRSWQTYEDWNEQITINSIIEASQFRFQHYVNRPSQSHFDKQRPPALRKDNPEAVVRRCSSKEVFLKISQYSQENTCIEISF